MSGKPVLLKVPVKCKVLIPNAAMIFQPTFCHLLVSLSLERERERECVCVTNKINYFISSYFYDIGVVQRIVLASLARP
jgi:hypothetical protein